MRFMSNQQISIITGTLNRCYLLSQLISNTVDNNERLELILVDGGSIDGTIEFIRNLNHRRIKLIEYSQRSSYPHFMNLGIKNATHDLICQWNDDVIMENNWQEVFNEIDDSDIYLFAWHNQGESGWHLHNQSDIGGEVVMNYGIYKRHVFEQAGLYNMSYKYYCADGEMSLRAYCSNFKLKNLHNIHVVVLPEEKRAICHKPDMELYYSIIQKYHSGNIDRNVEYLQCKN